MNSIFWTICLQNPNPEFLSSSCSPKNEVHWLIYRPIYLQVNGIKEYIVLSWQKAFEISEIWSFLRKKS